MILVGDVVWHYHKLEICSKRQCTIWWGHTSPFYFRPLERGWRKAKEGTPGPPKVPLRQEVVSVHGQRRGQRIVVPVKKLFAREKRPYGLGMVGKLTNRTYRKRIDSYVKRQIEDMDDHRYKTSHYWAVPPHSGWCWWMSSCCLLNMFFVSSRPFFTYWITFVHLLITILAVSIYGFAPPGFSQHETVDSVSPGSDGGCICIDASAIFIFQ